MRNGETVEDNKNQSKQNNTTKERKLEHNKNQTQAHTQESAIFKIKLEKADGKISVKSAETVPIYMQNDKSKGSPDRYKIIDLTSIVMSYDAGESFYSKEEAEGAANKISSIRSIVGENIYNVKTE